MTYLDQKVEEGLRFLGVSSLEEGIKKLKELEEKKGEKCKTEKILSVKN